MSLHTDGRGNWVTGEELNAMNADAQRTGAAALFGIAGVFVGPKLGAIVGLGSGKSMILGFIGGAIVGYMAGMAIIGLATVGFLIWWFVKS